ncbi:hypothetical protein KP509_38G062900 [Ceratopteris richardii]|uniref:Uncharacterized protein n=1 Tax=Ceratopteris richardii TaxID=49495 RepID=A0A8T2Q6F2_CERRI|nr:hypothetical protein KP509_38G062900 [Ceratopteris richardii]
MRTLRCEPSRLCHVRFTFFVRASFDGGNHRWLGIEFCMFTLAKRLSTSRSLSSQEAAIHWQSGAAIFNNLWAYSTPIFCTEFKVVPCVGLGSLLNRRFIIFL